MEWIKLSSQACQSVFYATIITYSIKLENLRNFIVAMVTFFILTVVFSVLLISPYNCTRHCYPARTVAKAFIPQNVSMVSFGTNLDDTIFLHANKLRTRIVSSKLTLPSDFDCCERHEKFHRILKMVYFNEKSDPWYMLAVNKVICGSVYDSLLRSTSCKTPHHCVACSKSFLGRFL